jgi:uncharacterized protein
VATNYVEAVKWFRKAAEQNHAQGQCNLGHRYATGQGVPKDETEAAKWYRKAAEQNYAEAQNRLGYYYCMGLGVAKDETEAAKWYRKAAEQNYAYGQYNLGISYAYGQGVTKDYVEAYKWLSLSFAKGHEKAEAAKSSLVERMTVEQIAEGFRLAHDFKPTSAPKSGASAPTR